MTSPTHDDRAGAQQAGEGWQLVPKEPTDGMITAIMSNTGSAHVASDPEAAHRQDCIDAYRAMLSASPAPPSGWREIASAPKDGTEILILYPLFNVGNISEIPNKLRPLIVHWNGRGWDATGWMLHEDPTGWMLHEDPTHWQPLPPAPSSGERT
jgi:hypothetical protein